MTKDTVADVVSGGLRIGQQSLAGLSLEMERIMEAVISLYSQMMSATGQTQLQMYKNHPQSKMPDPN